MSWNSTIGCITSKDSSLSAGTFFVIVSYVVLIPLIVVGNGLVVIAFIMNQKLRTATNIFICGLGLSDLLIGVFSVPYWTYISSLSSLVDAFCTPLYQVFICVDIGTGCASILQLTCIALERLYFTVAPLKHRRLSRIVYWIMLAVAWVFSIFTGGMQPVQSQAQWHDEYSIFLLVTCFLFPLFIIIAVYAYIFKVSREQSRRRPSTSNRLGSTGANIKEFHMFVTVCVITGVFIIAWAPFFITTVIANFCPQCIQRIKSDHLVRFVKWMQYSSSAINPYIYAYRNLEVRAFFKKVLCMQCLCSVCLARNSATQTPRCHGDNNNSEIFKENQQGIGDESVFEIGPLAPNVNQSITRNYNERVSEVLPSSIHSNNYRKTRPREDSEKRLPYRDSRRRENKENHREKQNIDRCTIKNETKHDNFRKKHNGKPEKSQNIGTEMANKRKYQATRANRLGEKQKTCRQGRTYDDFQETDVKRTRLVGRHYDCIETNQSYLRPEHVQRDPQHIRSFENQVDITSELNSTYV